MQLPKHQYNAGFGNGNFSKERLIFQFGEAGPTHDAAEAQAKKPEVKSETPKEPAKELGQESFDQMAQPFHAKFDEFKRGAEEATGEVAFGMRVTSMTDIANEMIVLRRFSEISNDYHARVRNLEANSPAYQEAAQVAKAELNDLMTAMDKRLQVLREGKKENQVPESKGEARNTPSFMLDLKDVPISSPREYNRVMISNIEKGRDGLTKYLKDNQQQALANGIARVMPEPDKSEYIKNLSAVVERFIQNIQDSANRMIQVLKDNSNKPIAEQNRALIIPAELMSMEIAKHYEFMQTFTAFNLKNGCGEIGKKIIEKIDGASFSLANLNSDRMSEESKGIPEFSLTLATAPLDNSKSFNETMLSNIATAGQDLVNYLNANRERVVLQRMMRVDKDPEHNPAYKALLNSEIDNFITNLKLTIGAMYRKLKEVKDKPVEEQKKALEKPARAVGTEMARNRSVMQNYLLFKLENGYQSMNDKILKVFWKPGIY